MIAKSSKRVWRHGGPFLDPSLPPLRPTQEREPVVAMQRLQPRNDNAENHEAQTHRDHSVRGQVAKQDRLVGSEPVRKAPSPSCSAFRSFSSGSTACSRTVRWMRSRCNE